MLESTGNDQASPRDKRANFVRLAESRTNSVMEKLRILSNLANRHLYEYSEEDVQQIFGAIEEETRQARNRFASSQRRKPSFKLGADSGAPDSPDPGMR